MSDPIDQTASTRTSNRHSDASTTPGGDTDPIVERFATEPTAAPPIYALKKDNYDHAVRRLVSGIAKTLLSPDFCDQYDVQREETVGMLDRPQKQQVDLRSYAENNYSPDLL